MYIHSIWKGFGGQCAVDDGGDPVVLYDKLANRWFVEQLEYTTTNQICIAVSATDDATGRYNRYASTFTDFPDYPTLTTSHSTTLVKAMPSPAPSTAVPCWQARLQR